MEKPDLLKDLGRVAHEDEAAENARWERWEKWSDGELSEEEEAELLALARTSPEDAAALEAFRPLGPEFRTRVLAALDAEEERPKAGIRGIALWLQWAFAGAAAAAAAAGVFVARLPAALPAYSIYAVAPGTASQRGEDDVTVLQQGDSFSATIQPQEKALPRDRDIKLLCFIQSRSVTRRSPAPCEPADERAESGSMKIQGQVNSATPAGPATLVIVVHDARRLPSPQELSRLPLDRATHNRSLSSAPKPIEIRAPLR